MTWKVTKEDTQHQLLDLSLFLSPFLPPSTRAHVRTHRQSAGPHICTRAHVRTHTDICTASSPVTEMSPLSPSYPPRMVFNFAAQESDFYYKGQTVHTSL